MKSKIPSKTRQQIATEYDIHYQSFWRKLEIAGIELPKGHVLPKWQKIIYEHFGYPNNVEKQDYQDL